MNKEELIQAYLENKLSKEKKAECDHMFETDADFRKEVQFHKDMKAAFSGLERERIKAKLQKFESEIHMPKQKTYTKWLVAASILIIIGIGAMTFLNNPVDSDQLYLSYFEPYENVVQPITRGESIENMKTEVFIAYEKAEYEKAAQGFNKLYQTTKESYYLLYEANALMANDQPEKAIPLLKKQLAANDAFAEKSRWYLALAYLKTKKPEKAKEFLREILNAQAFKSGEAENILGKLK